MRSWQPTGKLARGLAILIVLLVLWPTLTRAQDAPTENQVKAAFLFNFVKFIEWPADSFRDSGGRVRLCVLGEGPFEAELERITAGKVVNGRALEVVAVKQAERSAHCHVVFVNSSASARLLRKTLAELRGGPMLTVGESPEFTRQGGVIRLLLLDNRIRFEINLEAAEHAELKISSKLLALAQSVRGGRGGGG
jgi:hypothetical protein